MRWFNLRLGRWLNATREWGKQWNGSLPVHAEERADQLVTARDSKISYWPKASWVTKQNYGQNKSRRRAVSALK